MRSPAPNGRRAFLGSLAGSAAALLLEFAVSHPAVTCAIPATTSVAHVQENMGVARGPLPDEPMRQRIATLFAKL